MDYFKMTVGQMAKLNNVTPETLRHYDREGLLAPWIVDGQSGYRYYHINQSARLDMIQYLRTNGLSLNQIREYLESADAGLLSQLLRAHLQAIDDKMRRMQQNRGSIVRMLDNQERYKKLPDKGTLFYEHIKQRSIFVHKTKSNYFDQDDTGYELMLRELKGVLLQSGVPASYFMHAGTLVRAGHLAKRVLHSDEVFCFLEPDFRAPGHVETLPEGLFLCVCSDNFLQEAEDVRQLLEKMEQDGYHIAGDYVCEVVEEFPGFDISPRKLIYKAQIPVRKTPQPA